MLFLLDIQYSAIFESPFHNIGFMRSAFLVVARGKLGPEFVEVLQFDQVPDGGKGSVDNGGFRDRGGGWNAGCHCDDGVGSLGR